MRGATTICASGDLTTSELKTLQTHTFYGKEKKSLAYVIAIMNMILHGIDAPNIIHTNTLAENISDIQDKDRFDVILANPPFGGKERPEVQQNFPIKTGETAFLFLQHFIKSLKAGGRAAIVIKNTFLSNTDNAARGAAQGAAGKLQPAHRARLPGGTFQGAGVKTVVLFFEKGAPTRKIWYLPARSGPQPGQDQCAQRRRPEGVRRVASQLRGLREIMDGRCEEHRPDELRSFGEEPQQGRGSALARPAGHHRRDGGARCGERGHPRRHSGDAVRNGWEIKSAWRSLQFADGGDARRATSCKSFRLSRRYPLSIKLCDVTDGTSTLRPRYVKLRCDKISSIRRRLFADSYELGTGDISCRKSSWTAAWLCSTGYIAHLGHKTGLDPEFLYYLRFTE